MAFLAPLAEAAGPMLARAGASLLGRAAVKKAAGSEGKAAPGTVTQSPVMPIPSMGSNGPTMTSALGQANSYLNSDQFR